MSGSGGGGGGFATDEVACDRLQFETDVRSPNAQVVAQLQVGNVLQVVLRQEGGTEIIVLVFKGQDVGGIVSPKATRLRECIRGGTSYIATVIAKRANNIVGVRVTPISV